MIAETWSIYCKSKAVSYLLYLSNRLAKGYSFLVIPDSLSDAAKWSTTHAD